VGGDLEPDQVGVTGSLEIMVKVNLGREELGVVLQGGVGLDRGIDLTDGDTGISGGGQVSGGTLGSEVDALEVRNQVLVVHDETTGEGEVGHGALVDTTNDKGLDLVGNVESAHDHGASRTAPTVRDNLEIRGLPGERLADLGPRSVREVIALGIGILGASTGVGEGLGEHGRISERLVSLLVTIAAGIKDRDNVLSCNGLLGGGLDKLVRADILDKVGLVLGEEERVDEVGVINGTTTVEGDVQDDLLGTSLLDGGETINEVLVSGAAGLLRVEDNDGGVRLVENIEDSIGGDRDLSGVADDGGGGSTTIARTVVTANLLQTTGLESLGGGSELVAAELVVTFLVAVGGGTLSAEALPVGRRVREGAVFEAGRQVEGDSNLLDLLLGALDGVLDRVGLGDVSTGGETTGGGKPVCLPEGGSEGIGETDRGILGDSRGQIGKVLDDLQGGLAIDVADNAVSKVVGGHTSVLGRGAENTDLLLAVGNGSVQGNGLAENHALVALSIVRRVAIVQRGDQKVESVVELIVVLPLVLLDLLQFSEDIDLGSHEGRTRVSLGRIDEGVEVGVQVLEGLDSLGGNVLVQLEAAVTGTGGVEGDGASSGLRGESGARVSGGGGRNHTNSGDKGKQRGELHCRENVEECPWQGWKGVKVVRRGRGG